MHPFLKGKALALNTIVFTALLIGLFTSESARAAPDYIFFSVNGDTTGSTLNQGDEFFWGSNCDLGATINWEIWYDANSNSTIDTASDLLLSSENMTDGNLVTDPNPGADGWVIAQPFALWGEPGNYIFRATDISTDATVQKIATVVATVGLPNQFTGTISLPGVSPPSALLANHIVFAESDSGDEGVLLSVTDQNGFYSMSVGAVGTGVEFFIEGSNVDGYVTPDATSAVAMGLVANNDFAYIAPADSVWGIVKDRSGTPLKFETDVGAQSGQLWKNVTTGNSRYVIYFSAAEKGNWTMESDSRVSPAYLVEEQFMFSHDTVGSFEHDIVLTAADTAIYARVSEGGAQPVNNYRVDAYSPSLGCWSESVSGTGADNVVDVPASTLDASDWWVTLATWDSDYPIPTGMIVTPNNFDGVAPGDTVSFNLTMGKLVSSTITQDAGDGPIVWSDITVTAGGTGSYFEQTVSPGGGYSLYTDTGLYNLGIRADNYISNPAWRNVQVTGDTSGAGLAFTINESHCRVSGTLANVTLPLDNSYYSVTARTGTGPENGYLVEAFVDSSTGTYEMNLGDGNWTIVPPGGMPDVLPPAETIVAIGENPDSVRTINFTYSVVTGVGDDDGILPVSFSLDQNYPNPFNPSTTITFSLPVRSDVKLTVYNLLGQEVKQLINGIMPSGHHVIEWNGKNSAGKQVSTGAYLYRLTAGDYVETRKMLLLK